MVVLQIMGYERIKCRREHFSNRMFLKPKRTVKTVILIKSVSVSIAYKRTFLLQAIESRTNNFIVLEYTYIILLPIVLALNICIEYKKVILIIILIMVVVWLAFYNKKSFDWIFRYSIKRSHSCLFLKKAIL